MLHKVTVIDIEHYIQSQYDTPSYAISIHILSPF